MKIRSMAITLLAMGAILAATVVGASCGRNDRLGGVALDLLQKVPQEAVSYAYWDVRQMEDDKDLSEIADAWRNLVEADLQRFAIDVTEIRHAAQFSMPEGSAIIIRSDQKRDELRADLEALQFRDQDFRREEVWKNEDDTKWLSILGDLIVAGDKSVVMDCIRVAKGDPSLHDNALVRSVTEELRAGLAVYIERHDQETPYKGLEATGISLWKKNSVELSTRMVFRFETSGSAAAVFQALADDVDEFYNKVDAKRDGRIITLEAEIKIDHFEIWSA